MRDPKRIDGILRHIAAIWHKYPDLRLSQLIANCIPTSVDMYYIEDDKLLELLRTTYVTDSSIQEGDKC